MGGIEIGSAVVAKVDLTPESSSRVIIPKGTQGLVRAVIPQKSGGPLIHVDWEGRERYIRFTVLFSQIVSA